MPATVLSQHVESCGVARAASVRSALAGFRHGSGDPTTQLSRPGGAGDFARATWTPDGPGTVLIRWRPTPAAVDSGTVTVDVDSWGPGGDWLEQRAPAMIGGSDPGAPRLEDAADPVVASAARSGRHLRFGRSDDLYHELLPTVLEQRITAREAVRQWARLCTALGDDAPGPLGLRLPPAPDVLAQQPTWWFHPLGIERRRAATLIELARRPAALWEWAELGHTEAARRLQLLRGVGIWTVGSALGPALGDPDALCVGDYHAKNVVAWALHGRPRGTDEEMIESLAPYVGQRGRVLRLLLAAGHRPPSFGPRQRILPMHRW